MDGKPSPAGQRRSSLSDDSISQSSTNMEMSQTSIPGQPQIVPNEPEVYTWVLLRRSLQQHHYISFIESFGGRGVGGGLFRWPSSLAMSVWRDNFQTVSKFPFIIYRGNVPLPSLMCKMKTLLCCLILTPICNTCRCMSLSVHHFYFTALQFYGKKLFLYCVV